MLDIAKVLDGIRRMTYGEDLTALGEISREQRDPFKVLIATILSHRTRDENTEKASERLFSAYGTAAELARADLEKVREFIRPVGFYRVKAQKIRDVAQILLDKYHGRVPDTLDELIALPGVGRKTANCVLVYGFGKAAIPVDTHVHRISNRLGIVRTKTPEETEVALTKAVDPKYWLMINELFVKFGQTVCKPIGPRCDICLLRRGCKYYRTVARMSKRRRP